MRRIMNTPATGVKFTGALSFCDTCMLNKSTQQNHPKTADFSSVTERLQLVTTDLSGTITPTALGGYRYMAEFTDHCSRLKVVYSIKAKSEAISTLCKYVQDVAIPLGLRVYRLRSDRVGGNISQITFDDTAKLQEFSKNSRHPILHRKMVCQNATEELF
ncbi:unnamed protein product [Sphacelaria rigidula]